MEISFSRRIVALIATVAIVAVGLLVFLPRGPKLRRPNRPVLRQLAVPAAELVARVSTTICKRPIGLQSHKFVSDARGGKAKSP